MGAPAMYDAEGAKGPGGQRSRKLAPLSHHTAQGAGGGAQQHEQAGAQGAGGAPARPISSNPGSRSVATLSR